MAHNTSTETTQISRLASTMLILLAGVCIALHLEPGKPIWIDEFVQYCFGAFTTAGDAWHAIRVSIAGGLNHGQTGIYMLADYFLLRTFGASTFWLRFPSLLATGLLFWGSFHLFSLWKLPLQWRVFGCLAIFNQTWITNQIAEARPYMPLAGASVGVLAYYFTPHLDRSRLKTRLLGAISILTGVLFHPYFSVYWLFACVFSFFLVSQSSGEAPHLEKKSLTSFIRHANPILCFPGVIIYFGLGATTWMPYSINLNFDPFEWIGHRSAGVKMFLGSHIQFMWPLNSVFLAFALLANAAMLVPSLRARYSAVKIPTLLIVSSLLISAFLSYSSYRSHYWILQRQWIASVALITLGSVWFASAVSSLLPKTGRMIWTVAVIGLVGGHSAMIAGKNFQKIYGVLSHPKVDQFQGKQPPDQDPGVDLANLNVIQGGPVWPFFRKFYEPNSVVK